MELSSALDPIVVAQLETLSLKAKRVLEGFYSGAHNTKLKGRSQTFAEHRSYYPGDEPKDLDWKVFAKTDRLVVRQYEDQTNMGVLLMVDSSHSMGFSWGNNISKFEYARILAAALGYLTVSQRDAMGFVVDNVDSPLNTQKSQLDYLLNTLTQCTPQGALPWMSFFQKAQQSLKRRGFVVFISDLMTTPEEVFSALTTLQARNHEVLVIQVLDPFERDLNEEGTFLLEDSETHENLLTDFKTIRDSYQKIVQEKIAFFSQTLQSLGMDYLLLTTDLSFDKGLGAYLSWRKDRL
ncbi:MAG: DUF58 domain-containing protein [Elusimicrobiota bacterium]